MKLVTERLIMRRPEAKDAESYCAIHNSEFVLRYNAMMPTTKDRVERKLADEAYCNDTVFLEEKESGELIGAIFLEDDDLRYGVNSKGLSYFLREDHARKGYMKEAMRGVLAWLFETEKLECVSARAFAPNAASRALLRSLGFQENGIIPKCVKGYGDIVYDDVIHTLFQEDFHKE